MLKRLSNPRLLLLAAAMVMGVSPAIGQSCSGQYAAGQVCGNSGSAKGLPSAQALSPLVDRNFGSGQGTILNRGTSTWGATATPILGIPGSVTGSFGFAGSSGGTITVQAADSTGSWTFKLPTSAGSPNYVLITDGSGNSSWVSNSSGGTVTSVALAMPGIFTVSGSPVIASGTLTATLATQAKNLVWAGPSSGSNAAPTFRSLVGGDLPVPGPSTLGGIESYAAVTNQWIRSISTSGVPASSQPAFTDISGSVAAAQLPNPTASTLGGIESLVSVSSKWINTISTSGVPSATQPSFSDLLGAITLAQFPTQSNNTVLGNNTGGTAIPSGLTGSQVLDFIGTTQGNVLYRNGSVWAALGPGTSGQVLTTGGAAANPAWTTVTGTGTVTSVASGTGLTGGPITTTGTLALAAIANNTVLANVSGGALAPSSTTPTLILDVIGATEGDVLYRGVSAWLALAPGTSGQVLQTQGAGSTPQWANAGTVSSISAGTGLTGGTITTSGTVALDLAHANTWTAAQTFTNSDLKLLGSSTGGTTFTSANAGASNFTLTVPAITSTLVTQGDTATVALSVLATQAADTALVNASGGAASPTAVALGSCSAAGNALTYNTSTHAFGCNTISAAALSSKTKQFTYVMSTATGTQAVTGIGFVPTSCQFSWSFWNGLNSFLNGTGYSDSVKGGSASAVGTNPSSPSGGAINGAVSIIVSSDEAFSSYAKATISTYDSDGFTLSWVKTNAPSGTVTINALCFK